MSRFAVRSLLHSCSSAWVLLSASCVVFSLASWVSRSFCRPPKLLLSPASVLAQCSLLLALAWTSALSFALTCVSSFVSRPHSVSLFSRPCAVLFQAMVADLASASAAVFHLLRSTIWLS